jgi:excinuclease UvrABC ATPase subunit
VSDSGKSVIVVEHHQAVLAHADWIVDLGRGVGHGRGQIIFEGRLAISLRALTLTGAHVAA